MVTSGSDFSLWNLGFRPFYLLASLFSIVSIFIWTGQYSGYLPVLNMPPSILHAHEMLFGYTLAVMAGFLLTAVRVWTHLETPSGKALMALVALWVCARILMLTPLTIAATVVNAAFPVAIAVAIGIPLFQSRNVRNYFMLALLLLISLMIVIVNLALQGVLQLSPKLGMQLALDIVLFIMVVIAGRVIPMFTNNGVPGANARRQPLLETTSLVSVMLLFVLDMLQLPETVIAIVALICALLNGLRLCFWSPWRTLTTPLVWILHAGYAWIVIYLLLRGVSMLGYLSEAYAVHALTVGAIGGLTLGMMTRTARGHTARPLLAGRFELAIYLMIQGAAIVRVFGGVLFPGLYIVSIQLSGILWTTAFTLFVFRYWPVLTRPRLDGKPG